MDDNIENLAGAPSDHESNIEEQSATTTVTNDRNASSTKYTNASNEDFTMPPPSPSSTPKSFFSRMSSLGSTAAPILEQVYDRAHKKAALLKETNSLREAVQVVRAEIVKEPNVVDIGSVDDGSHYSSSEDDVESSGANDDTNDDKDQSNEHETKYTEFRTTGRYQDEMDEEDRAESPPIVGGADRLSGLHRLDNLVSLMSSSLTCEEKNMEDKIESAPRSYKRSSLYYEEAVKDLLQPGQRALFFGKGTMGVILKPTYLASWRGKDGGGLICPTNKRGGVFIDALVPDGHAERSGVVFVGDHVVKIGNLDVSNMTLEEVVKAIAEAERPSIMILMAQWEPVIKNHKLLGDEEEKRYFISPLELAFGYVNKIAAEGVQTKKELRAAISHSSLLNDDDDDDEEEGDVDDTEEVLFSSSSAREVFNGGIHVIGKNAEPQLPNNNKHQPTIDTVTVDDKTKNAIPTNLLPQDEIDRLIFYSAQRTNEHHDQRHTEQSLPKQNRLVPMLLARAAFRDPTLRSTLHEAFKECCNDPRKANFMKYFFTEYSTQKEVDAKRRSEQDKSNNGKMIEEDDRDEHDATSSTNQRKLLDIYLQLSRFRNEAAVCSISQLLENARVISATFLPDADNHINQTIQTLPEYVAYVAFGGAENLQSLKRALRDEDEFFEDTERDGFYKCREELGLFLSSQEHFLAFLISDDCARMRAYLRGTTPFVCIEPSIFITTSELKSQASSNFLKFAILHLICMKDTTDQVESSDKYGNFIRMDTMILNQKSGKRVAGAAAILSCPIFIMHTLIHSLNQAAESLVEDEMMGPSNNMSVYKRLSNAMLTLWNDFVSPVCGALALYKLADDAFTALDAIRPMLASSLHVPVSQGRIISVSSSPSLVKLFTSAKFSSALQTLCDALIQNYCQMIYPNFQRHIFYEWALMESLSNEPTDLPRKTNEYLVSHSFNGLLQVHTKKILRQIELPQGVSSHLPCSRGDTPIEDDACELGSFLQNAEVAIVFGTYPEDDALPNTASDLSSDSIVSHSNIKRLASGSLHPEIQQNSSISSKLNPTDIPDNFEEYMRSPPFCDRPFKGMLCKENNNRTSVDGWEVSLTNTMIPVGKGTCKMLYCVSLALSNIDTAGAQLPLNVPSITSYPVGKLCYEAKGVETQTDHDLPQCIGDQFQSPLFEVTTNQRITRNMKVSHELIKFNAELKKRIVSKSNIERHLVGISLVSRRNVIPAMRHTLSLFVEDLCSKKSGDMVCQPLIDLLGVFSCPSVEEMSLQCILKPYMSYASSPWIHRPITDQSTQLVASCGMQMLQSLPPVPLALLFVTAMLEQKIVISSSRRSMLMAASLAITHLMQPLKWTHLLVPYAPMSMLNDLIHYPAPFILGLSTDEKQSARILRSLPPDVSLVDLDIGRVMLASDFVNQDDALDEDTKESSQSALRSQVLVLAEYLGGIFGSAIYKESWCCDSPFNVISAESGATVPSDASSRFSTIQTICEDFLTELISGISSCCLWIEDKKEETDSWSNQAILFDEDLFMHIKNSPSARMNRLNLGQFNLILRAFLRTQCLNTLISTEDKNMSLFS